MVPTSNLEVSAELKRSLEPTPNFALELKQSEKKPPKTPKFCGVCGVVANWSAQLHTTHLFLCENCKLEILRTQFKNVTYLKKFNTKNDT
jgi:hypothetical protein